MNMREFKICWKWPLNLVRDVKSRLFVVHNWVKINDNGSGKNLREGGRCHQSSVLIVAECGSDDCVEGHKNRSRNLRN